MTVLRLRDTWVDWAEVLVDVMIGYACNVQCDYCSITDEMRKENMATAPVMAALAEARRHGAVKVAFGGGEPTIRRSLLPLVRWCRDRGYRSIKIPSNGLMYSYRAFAEEAGGSAESYRPLAECPRHRQAVEAAFTGPIIRRP